MKSPDQNAGRGPACSRQDRCQSLRQAEVQIKLPLSQVQIKCHGWIFTWMIYSSGGGSSIHFDKELYIYIYIYYIYIYISYAHDAWILRMGSVGHCRDEMAIHVSAHYTDSVSFLVSSQLHSVLASHLFITFVSCVK